MTVSPWLAWPVTGLALLGAWWLLAQVFHAVVDAAEAVMWWWRDRRQPLTDEDPGFNPCHCIDEACGCYADALDDLLCEYCRSRGHPAWDDRPDELPPERSREELGFTGEQPAIPPEATYAPFIVGDLGPHRERRAPWYEAEYRHHYAAMDLDYPSGLLARVREAGQ